MSKNSRFQSEEQQRTRRELELLAAGFALAQGSNGGVVADSLKRGSLNGDIDDFLEAIRSNDKDPVINFLSARGAKIEKGKHAIDAIVDAILKQNAEEKIRRICRRIDVDRNLENLPTIIDQVKRMTEELEEIQRDF